MTAMLLSLLIPGITPLAEGNSVGSIPDSELANDEAGHYRREPVLHEGQRPSTGKINGRCLQ